LQPLTELFGVVGRVGNLLYQLLCDHFQSNDLVGSPTRDVGHASRAEIVSGI
jgi:hypothetical protein